MMMMMMMMIIHRNKSRATSSEDVWQAALPKLRVSWSNRKQAEIKAPVLVLQVSLDVLQYPFLGIEAP